MTAANRDTAAARTFHNATKMYLVSGADWERDDSIRLGDPSNWRPALGPQDPANEPQPYKIYMTLPALPLPRPEPAATLSALDALVASGNLPAGTAIPDLDAVARICLRANGLLKTWTNPSGRTWEFRAAGCTGARYHIELYLVCGDLPGLDAGIYHYGAHDHALRQLRAGDFRGHLVTATGAEPATAQAPLIIVSTSTFWRNAWRYRERAYRHVYWDTGTMLGNLLAVAADAQLPARAVLGFVDADVNALLGVDGDREAATVLVAIGRQETPAPTPPALTPIDHLVKPISTGEIDYPAIGAMHRASSLTSAADVVAWRATRPAPMPTAPDDAIPLRSLPESELPVLGIDEVINRRRSFRRYDTSTRLSFPVFSTVIARSGRTVALDCNRDGQAALTTRVLLVNRVEGLKPGAYAVNSDGASISLLRPGDVSELAFELATYQTYAGEAHVNAYELADLDRALEAYGNRGYRVAQLEAAIAGARLQLAAHALGLGAVGSTSLDDRVTEALSPGPDPLSFMFVAVFGERARRSSTAPNP